MQSSMRVGYLIDVHGGPYDQPIPSRADVVKKLDALIEEGIAAEQSGFHSIAVPDRHGRTETYFPGPLQLLTLLARETSHAALGTFSLISTLVHPMLVAEQAAIIDNLSKGRFFLALARGYHEGYWDYFGVKPERLLGRHMEAVRVIKQALLGERFTFEGDFYQVRDSVLTPQAYQEGGFPIWGAGDSVKAMLRGVEYGEAWPASPFPIFRPAWEERLAAYREKCDALGKQPYVVLMRDGWVANSFEEAAESFGRHYAEEMLFYQRQGILQQVHPFFDSPEKITVDTMRGHAIMGTPSQCIEQLEELRENLGVDYVMMRFRMPTGPSFEAARDQIYQFGADVVSPIHAKYPEPPNHPAIPEGSRW